MTSIVGPEDHCLLINQSLTQEENDDRYVATNMNHGLVASFLSWSEAISNHEMGIA